MQQQLYRWIRNTVLQLLLLPLIMLAALIVLLWIMMMELVITRFLSEEANKKRNWELTYWYE